MAKSGKKTAENTKKTRSKQGKPRSSETSWKPGQTGNPNGRPRSGFTWADIIRQVGEELHGKSKKTKKRAAIENVYKIANGRKDKKAVIAALKFLSDREDGKPAETVKIDGILRDERLKDVPDDQLLKIIEDAKK